MEKTKKTDTTGVPPTTLEQLVLDRREGKYELIAPISWHAKQLRKLEEHRHLTQTDLLELAMQEVLSGKVTMKELEKRMREAPPEPVEASAEKPRKAKEAKDSD